MTRKLIIIMVCVFILFPSLACQLFAGPNLPTAPTNTPAEVATPEIEPSATVDVAATTQAFLDSQKATEEAEALAATESAAAEETQQAENILAQTAEVAGQATQQADSMYQLIEKLKTDGVLENTAGAYYPIEDFEENWAQLNWYQWWNTGYKPSNFVVRAHTSWESASRTANWFSAGCGFVFRATDVDNHYMIFLALDGNVYMRGYVDAKYRTFGKAYAGNIEHVKGEADIILIAEGDHFVYYVNGNKVFDKNNSDLLEGDLALTLNSGTNKDYGTRCKMTDIELWALDE